MQNITQGLPNFKGTQWENKTGEEIFLEFKNHVPATINKQFPNRKRFLQTHMLDEDDIEQFGYLGLWQAIETYDPNAKAKFESFVISNIVWKIKVLVKEFSLRTKIKSKLDLVDVVSTEKKVSNSEDADMTIESSLVDETIDEQSEFNTLLDTVKRLLKEEKNQIFAEKMEYIIIARYEGKTEEEIAKHFGITRQAIYEFLDTQQAKRFRSKLKKHL